MAAGDDDSQSAAEGAALRAEDAELRAESAAGVAERALEASRSIADELLIHPEDVPHPENESRFGQPGPPLSRRHPFYVGFVGGLGVFVAVLLALALQQTTSVLVVLAVSGFLAVGLNPLVEMIIRRGLRRRVAVLIVTVVLVALIALSVYALVPVLRDQVTALINTAPSWLQSLRHNPTVRHLDEKYGIISTINHKLQDPNLSQQAFGSIFTFGLAVVGAVFNAFLVFVLTIYFLTALPTIKRSFYSLVPASRRGRATYLGDEILRKVGGYVGGAFVVALCAGVSSFIFLAIAGLSQYALALALIVMVTDFIPLVGATIGAGIVTIIGFATSPGIGVACLVFYIVYQQLENYLIYPRVMASSVNVPGVVTVVAVLIGGSLIGVVGALMAIPIAAAALLLLDEIVVRNQAES